MRPTRDYSNAVLIAMGLADTSILDRYDRIDYAGNDEDPRMAGCRLIGALVGEQAERLESIEDKLDRIINHLGVK